MKPLYYLYLELTMGYVYEDKLNYIEFASFAV